MRRRVTWLGVAILVVGVLVGGLAVGWWSGGHETIAEAALPAYEMPSWRSIMGPAGMKPDVVRTLNQAIVRAVQSSEVRERFMKSGSVAMSSTPEELRKRYEHWMEIFGRIAAQTGLNPQ